MHRRGRDALVVGGVLGIEGMRAVQADPRDALAGRGGGDLGARRFVVEEVPVHRRAHVAEHRAGPAGQDGRQPPPLPREHRPTDRVDAAVHPAQAPPPATRRCAARGPMPQRAATAPATPPPTAAEPARRPPPSGVCASRPTHMPRQRSTPPENPSPPATRDRANAKSRHSWRRPRSAGGGGSSRPRRRGRRQDDVSCTRPALRAARTTGRCRRRWSPRAPRTARRPCRSRA